MNQLNRTVRMKLPATVVDTRPIVTMTAAYHAKADLVAAVQRGSRRGEIKPLAARPGYNERAGQWEWPVQRLREPAPAWIRPAAIVLAVLALLGSLAGLGWWMLTSLAGLPLAAFLLGVLSALFFIVRAGRTPTVNVTQNVTIRR